MTISEREPLYCCPYCHSDNTQRFLSVFENGVTESRGYTTGLGSGHIGGKIAFGTTVHRTVNYTAAARKTRPPVEKSIPAFAWILSLLLVPFALLLIFVAIDNHRWNKNEFPKLAKIWMNSWLCHKCGNSFCTLQKTTTIPSVTPPPLPADPKINRS